MSPSHRRLTAGLAAVPVDRRPAPGARRHFGRLLVVANRLPATAGAGPDDGIETCAATLAPHLEGGAWIGGWSGHQATDSPALTCPEVRPVVLPTDELRDHDQGFCRQTLRPLFHGLLEATRFEPRWWQAYRRVNRRFSDAVALLADPSTLVWVHGPELSGVGALLRTRRSAGRSAESLPGLAHSLHGPFPPRELFLGLPWRRELLTAFLSHDLLGFESRRDVENFVDCLALVGARGGLDGDRGSALVPSPESPDGWRAVGLEVTPRGVDFRGISRLAGTSAVREAVADLRAGAGRGLLVAVERLDPSRGLAPLLAGFAALLEVRPNLVRRAGLLLVVDPGPGPLTDGPLRADVERRVGEINGRFSHAGCPAIFYHLRRFDRTEQVAFHRAADVILSTSTEEPSGRQALAAAAARTDGDGVLVVSDLSAAVARLAPDRGRGALAVNPHDVEALTATILRALALPEAERRRRMRSLRTIAADADVESWVTGFCHRAGLLPRRPPSLIDVRRPARRSPRRSPNGPAARPA